MPVIYDPVNLGAASGTEQMLRGLEKRIDFTLLQPFSIGRAIMLFDPNTIKVYWTHNIPGQMGIREVSEKYALALDNRWKFVDTIVFVSEWQKQKYIEYFKFNEEDQTRFKVLQNAIEPIEFHTKPSDKIKLIYTSVPERGLDILYEAFNRIAHKYDIELHVYSSYKIYGIPQTDIVYGQLLNKVKSHPKIIYHGTVSNDEIRNAFKESHIFAYPSTFLETSCMSLIEAMSAGCICVHSDVGALSETSSGYTNMYEFTRNKLEHINIFEAKLEEAISQVGKDMLDQKKFTDETYSWSNRIIEWNDYLRSMI